jgi:GT2 family glycosyltransferase
MRRISKQQGLAVVTVNYHSRGHLERLTASLNGTDLITELVIVDHSSSNGPVGRLAARFPVTVIPQRNGGYGAGLNRGLRHLSSGSDIVMVCNPDIELLDGDELAEAAGYIREWSRVGCVIPGMVRPDGTPIHSARKFFTSNTMIGCRIESMLAARGTWFSDHYYPIGNGDRPAGVDWGSGSAMLFRRDLFPNVIKFDERFFLYFEDVDICAQMWNSGYSVVQWPRVILSHVEQRRSRHSIKHLSWLLAGALRFIVKYGGLPDRARLVGREPGIGLGLGALPNSVSRIDRGLPVRNLNREREQIIARNRCE